VDALAAHLQKRKRDKDQRVVDLSALKSAAELRVTAEVENRRS